jgi:hypothetical protein
MESKDLKRVVAGISGLVVASTAAAHVALVSQDGTQVGAQAPRARTVPLIQPEVPSQGAVSGEDRGYEKLVESSFVAEPDDVGLLPEPPQPESGGAIVTGTRRAWQPLTLSWTGPLASELDVGPNPFLDFRLVVHFTGPKGQVYDVPGFFDGDGEGGALGDVWRVRFAPDQKGTWQYKAFFHSGAGIAVDLDLSHGATTAFHGDQGTFNILELQERAPGFYAWGRLEYVGEHYLKFRDGGYFIKGGVDSPENFLGYSGFDNTWDQAGGAATSGLVKGLHRFVPHVKDFGPTGLGDENDPYFKSEDTGYDSKGIIGTLNYLGRLGVNSIFFLPMNMGGDGRETVPFVGFGNNAFDKTHYDISKLTQWNQVFEHAQRKKILLHVVLAETEVENEQWLDKGNLGVERKLFYREMVARFGHALALKWNLCEENDYSTAKVKQFADYLRKVDPYDHPLAFHTHLIKGTNEYPSYDAVLGDPNFDATSLQTQPEFADENVEKWRAKSAASGHKWVAEIDEISPPHVGLAGNNAVQLRKDTLYPVFFSGGNIEWYLGYHDLPLGGDMNLEDFRTRQEMWIYMRFARRFMESYLPFWEMQPADELVSGESQASGGAQVFAKPGSVYAIYYPEATSTGTLDLGGTNGSFAKMWFDPRLGVPVGALQNVEGGSLLNVGYPPSGTGGTAFLEQDGLLVMEVESAPKVGEWAAESTHAGYTGPFYYRWNGPNYFNKPGVDALRYDFTISKAGKYNLRIHNRHDHPEPDLENDCWVRLDGGDWIKVYSNQGQATVKTWNWHTMFELPASKVAASYQLTSGLHTLEISGRSTNFMIDRIHLYDGSVANPTSTSHPESPLGGGSAPTSEDWVLLVKKQ